MLPHILAFAAPAAAFLVLPDMAPSSKPDESEGTFKALPVSDISPFAIPPTAESQTINVPCAECHGDDATVRFDIKVHDKTKLLVNGFEVYPADEPLNAVELKASVSSMPGSEGVEEPLNWVIWWEVEEVDQEQGMMILDWHIDVASVGDKPVSNVAMALKLIVGPNGELFIADAEVPPPQVEEPACTGLWCEFEELWNSLFVGGKGCHKAPEEMIIVDVIEMDDEPQNVETSEMPEQSEGYSDAEYGRLFADLVDHLIVPVILGMMSGVGIAAIVMGVCSLFSFIKRKISSRKSKSSYTHIPAHDPREEVDEDEEKHGLVQGQAPPPAYEEPVEKE